MFSAMLLTISLVALVQFAVYYWRSVVAGVAAQTISEEVLAAVSLQRGALSGGDFDVVAKLHELTPNLQKEPTSISLVSAYFRLVQAIKQFAGGHMEGLANWAEREQALCTRYAAVQVDRRLQSNLAFAASMRSC